MFNRVSPYFHHPFWGTPIFGNIHVKKHQTKLINISNLNLQGVVKLVFVFCGGSNFDAANVWGNFEGISASPPKKCMKFGLVDEKKVQVGNITTP